MTSENRPDGAHKPAMRRHHWKRIHHSRLFWVGVVLFLTAITIYVLSDDLAWRPWIAAPGAPIAGVNPR